MTRASAGSKRAGRIFGGNRHNQRQSLYHIKTKGTWLFSAARKPGAPTDFGNGCDSNSPLTLPSPQSRGEGRVGGNVPPETVGAPKTPLSSQ